MRRGSSVWEGGASVPRGPRGLPALCCFQIKGLEGNVRWRTLITDQSCTSVIYLGDPHPWEMATSSKLEGSQGGRGLLPTHSNTVTIYAIQSMKRSQTNDEK